MSCHGVNLVEINVGLIFLIKTSKCIFNLSVVISLHDDPAHHIEQVRQFEVAGNVRIYLNSQVLQLLLCWIDPEMSEKVSKLFCRHQTSLSLIKLIESFYKLQNVGLTVNVCEYY